MAFGNQGQIGFNNSIVAAIQAGNTIINKNGIFIYNGTPALGNSPIIWETPPGVTSDPFGNPLDVSGGVSVVRLVANVTQQEAQLGSGIIKLAGGSITNYFEAGTISVANSSESLTLASPRFLLAHPNAVLELNSGATASAIIGIATQFYITDGGLLTPIGVAKLEVNSQASEGILTEFGTGIQGDTVYRFDIDSNGELRWGPGNAATDTDLFRSAVGILKTGNEFNSGSLNIPTNAGDHFGVGGTGQVFLIAGTVGTTIRAVAQVIGDTNSRWTIDANGKMSWGPGNAATDISLFRSSGGTLEVSQSLVVANSLQVLINSILNSVTAANINVNSGNPGNIFAVGTGPSDFAGTVFIEDSSAPATPGTASGLYSKSGKLHYVSEDSNDYTTGNQIVHNTVGQTISSTTFVNVTGLGVHVGIGSYILDINLVYTEGAAAGIPSMQISGPAASLVLTGLTVQQTGTPPSSSGGRTASSLNSSMGLPTMGSVGRNQVVHIHTFVTTTAAGTLQLQALTSAAADPYTIQAGSDMILTPV